MSEQLDQIKAKLASQSAALASITENVTGITADVQALKAKIEELQNNGEGASPEELAELLTSVDSISGQIDAIGATTASLDAETTPEDV